MVSWVKTSTLCILVETKINFELQALTVTCGVLYPSCLLLLWTKCFLDESFYCSSCKDVILIFHWLRLAVKHNEAGLVFLWIMYVMMFVCPVNLDHHFETPR